MPVYVRKNLRYDELAQTIAENINKLCPSRIAPKKEIAKQCGVSPSLVTPCLLTGPITFAVPEAALQVSTHLIYYIRVPVSHEGPPPLGLGMLF